MCCGNYRMAYLLLNVICEMLKQLSSAFEIILVGHTWAETKEPNHR
jgi:hypothetical protein